MLEAILLSIIAGYADTVGYIHFNAFAGLMTGNTILLGIEIATKEFPRALFHVVIIAAFLAGVIVSRGVLRLGLRPWAALTLTASLFVVCSFIGVTAGAILLAFAMGIQNSAANRFNGVALNTVFITGNLQKLGEEIAHLLWPHRDRPNAGNDAPLFALVWVGYAGGAALGAFAANALTMPLLIPAAVLPFVAIRLRA